MGRAIDSLPLKDRDAVLKQFFSTKIANVRLEPYLFLTTDGHVRIFYNFLSQDTK